MKNKALCMLMILDGWGINPQQSGNAVYLAGTPNLNRLLKTYPNTQLLTSGESVGLPAGIMGNSEVGHMNIGAGRIVYQDLLRIDLSVRDGSFFENDALNSAMTAANENDSTLHLMGLVSDGGVHSHIRHVSALLELARKRTVSKVYVHAILDGRDTPPDSGAEYIAGLIKTMDRIGLGKIATICGRYYAMDRDKRWDRNEKAYRLYTRADGIRETDPVAAIRNAYRRGETDEFVKPIVITDKGANPLATLQDHDGFVFFNFRADRARQITRAFTDPDFDGFQRDPCPKLSRFVTMTRYDEQFKLPMAFPPVHLDKILGEVVGSLGLHQLRIAETEKYAHVTYFFNGGEEIPFPGEDRCLIPSPRDIPTYDYKPEMSALKVTEEAIQRIDSKSYDMIVLNFANMDMVGHTGVLDAAIQACRTVDSCVGEIIAAVKKQNGCVLVTADHGNAEKMLEDNGNIHTAHTLNPVRLILVDDTRKNARLKTGILADIAPTMLEIMGIEQPEQMTGTSLIEQ